MNNYIVFISGAVVGITLFLTIMVTIAVIREGKNRKQVQDTYRLFEEASAFMSNGMMAPQSQASNVIRKSDKKSENDAIRIAELVMKYGNIFEPGQIIKEIK